MIKNNYDVKIVKFNIINIILSILFIVWIPLVILTNNSFIEYGWAVNNIHSTISISSETTRIWMLIISVFILAFSIYSFYLSFLLKDIKKYWLGLGFFNWIFLFDSIKYSILNKSWKYYFCYMNQNVYKSSIISFTSLYEAIKYKKRLRRIDVNTIWYIITFIFFLTGFIMFNIPDELENVSDSFVFSILSYYTHISNGLCFIFLLFLPFIQNKIIMNNNSLFINFNSYIIVVGFSFWVFLFPGMLITKDISEYNYFNIVRSTILHGTNPVLFVLLCVKCCRTTVERQKLKKYFSSLYVNLTLPVFYCIYCFSLPFISRLSIYGPFTDCNYLGYAYFNNELEKIGTLLSLVMIPLILFLTSLSMYLTRILIKHKNKKIIIVYF